MKDRIRQCARERKNMSLPQLEESLGFSAGLISKWEKSSPSVDKIAKVASFLGVSVDYLLGNTDDPNPPSASVRYITDDDLRFALFSGKPATEAQLREVKRFAAFVMQRDADQ